MNRALLVGAVLLGIAVPATGGFSQSAGGFEGFLDRLEAGDPVRYRNLTVVPVSAGRTESRRPDRGGEAAELNGLAVVALVFDHTVCPLGAVPHESRKD